MTTERPESTKQKGSNWLARPPRMRAACTECHAAKTRCSGEKTGCQRCTNFDLVCEYGVSMVGRAPKRRAIANNQTHQAQPQSVSKAPSQPQAPSNTTEGNRPALQASIIPTDGLGNRNSQSSPDKVFENDLVAPFIYSADNPIRSPDFDGELFEGLDWSVLPSATSTSESCVLDALSFGLDNMPFLSQPGQTYNTSSTPSSTENSSHSRHSSASTQSTIGWVVALTKLVQLLETQIQCNLTAMDKVLHINKACISKVAKFMDQSFFTKCRSCPSLLLTIMELIITLYENGFCAEDQHQEPYSAVAVDLMPHVGFGVFQIDPEEQTFIRNRIICSEVKKCSDLIRKLRQSPSMSSEANPAFSYWYDAMENRIEKLKTMCC